MSAMKQMMESMQQRRDGQPPFQTVPQAFPPTNPHPPPQQSNESTTDPLKRNKAFKQILTSKATQFDGTNCLDYKPWKDALLREVAGLDPNAAQWLDLLEVRTTGTANRLIKDLRVIHLEASPEQALKSSWETLDQRFHTKQRPSQYLLQNLLQGPIISSSEPNNLFAFARSCKTATELHRSSQGLLASLEEETTQETIARRLDQNLYVDWQRFRRKRFGRAPNIPFERFSTWIMEQAEIFLDCQNATPNIYQSSTKPNHTTTHPNQPRRANSPIPRRDPVSSSSTQNKYLNSSGRYPTGFGKPIHESSRASSPVKPPQSQDQKPIFCAWCRENGVTHVKLHTHQRG